MVQEQPQKLYWKVFSLNVITAAKMNQFLSQIKRDVKLSCIVSVMRVGTDTFGDLIFQKGLQN